MRDETEWVELVECGANILVGADYDTIITNIQKYEYDKKYFAQQLYGDGKAGEKIIELLLRIEINEHNFN